MGNSDKPGKEAKSKPAANKKKPASQSKSQKGNTPPSKGKTPAKTPPVPKAKSPDDDWGHELEQAIEGLNLKQTKFVMEYAKTRNGVQSYRAAYGDHIAYSSAGSCSHELLKNPKIRKAIRIFSNSIVRQYRCDPEFIMQELAKLAHFNPDDILQIDDDGMATIDLSMADRDMLGALEHIETEELFDTVEDEKTGEEKRVRVGQKVKVKVASRRAVLNDLAKIQKMYEANFSPRAETARIMKELEEGELTTLEAAYRFTALGLPLPEVIKIQLTKGMEDGDKPEDKTPKTDEELDAAYRQAIATVQDQQQRFLPQRQQEVLEIKEELKSAESFAPPGTPFDMPEEQF